MGREENFELPPDSSHSAPQVTSAHADGHVQNRATHHARAGDYRAVCARVASKRKACS